MKDSTVVWIDERLIRRKKDHGERAMARFSAMETDGKTPFGRVERGALEVNRTAQPQPTLVLTLAESVPRWSERAGSEAGDSW